MRDKPKEEEGKISVVRLADLQQQQKKIRFPFLFVEAKGRTFFSSQEGALVGGLAEKVRDQLCWDIIIHFHLSVVSLRLSSKTPPRFVVRPHTYFHRVSFSLIRNGGQKQTVCPGADRSDKTQALLKHHRVNQIPLCLFYFILFFYYFIDQQTQFPPPK